MVTGRPPEIGETRDYFLRVRLAPSELAAIDLARNGESRSAFAREALKARTKGVWAK